jgi:hypothetical protein
LKLTVELTREDSRIRVTATDAADEWGSQTSVSRWTNGDATEAAIANLVGGTVMRLGLRVPEAPPSEPRTLNLGEPDLTPTPPRTGRPSVAQKGDIPGIISIVNTALAEDRRIHLDYTNADDQSTHRMVTPIALDWGINGRVLKASDDGVPKTFYLSRIDRVVI